MTKKRIIIFSVVVLLFLIVGSYTLAQPASTEATLLVTEGQANVLHPQTFLVFTNNSQTTLTAGEILAVQQGDAIEVASASAAVLTMGDGTSVELFSDTIVEVSELFADENNLRVRLTLLAGKTVNQVQRLLKTDDAYDVRTPSSSASVRGTLFTVSVQSKQETFYSVDEGVVAVQMGAQEVMVEAGFEVTAVTGQSLTIQPQTTHDSSNDGTVSTPPSRVDAPPAPETGNTPSPSAAEINDDHKVADPAVDDNQLEETAADIETLTITGSDAAPSPSGSTSTPPTATLAPPTSTPAPPTATRVPPTDAPAPPTNTSVPPTTTPVPPSPTTTPAPPTATPVPPPPPTATPVPPPPTTTSEPEKVTLCHKGNTISVDPSSVQDHLDHGDSLGPCP